MFIAPVMCPAAYTFGASQSTSIKSDLLSINFLRSSAVILGTLGKGRSASDKVEVVEVGLDLEVEVGKVEVGEAGLDWEVVVVFVVILDVTVSDVNGDDEVVDTCVEVFAGAQPGISGTAILMNNIPVKNIFLFIYHPLVITAKQTAPN